MKKITVFLIIALAIFLLPLTAFAVDYSIESMYIDADLKENGDVFITEKQTYLFDSEFNGITRTLIPKEGTDIIDVKATENNTSLEIEQDGRTYKIHRSGEDETITIKLTYTIKQGVHVYSDVGEFYWSFFDSGNESDYEAFEVIVFPPEPTNDVIAFGYDASEEKESIMENGEVHYNFGHVSSGKEGAVRVAYDKSLFASAPLTKNIAMKDQIEAEQQRLIQQRILFQEKQKDINSIAPYVIGFLTLLFISSLLYARRKKQMVLLEVERQYPTPYFVPEAIMSLPATLFYMKNNMVQPEILSAALMDLLRKGYIKERPDESLEVVSVNTTHNHERILIHWLFEEIGHGGVFKTEDLDDYIAIKENQQEYQEEYAKWQKAILDEKKEYCLTSKNIKARIIIGTIGLVIIPFVIFLGIYESYLFMTIGIILSLAFIVLSLLFVTRTVEGARIKRDWKAFQDKYPELKDGEWDNLVSDDQKRAFIYSVGVNNKEMNEKNEVLLNRFPDASYSASNPMYFLMFANITSGTFNNAQSSSAQSADGGSAGIGGGTGAGGGGGGSGAF